MRDTNQNYNEYGYNNYPQKNNNGGSGLIVAISILASLIVVIIIIMILFATGVLHIGKNAPVETPPMVTETTPASTQTPAPVVKQPVPVGKYMYIGNCKSSVTLRVGPGTNFDEIRQIGLGEEIYVVEYSTDDFALVEYSGNRGYVMRDYVVSVRPEVWSYDATNVENFVASSLRAFVNGVTTGDNRYVYNYYSGSAVEQELKSHAEISSVVAKEEILSLKCHSTTRISASQVTVIRESVIRVTYNDGSQKDVTEKYKYTVDLVDGMSIVGLSAM
ncbi:MAG: SH3 domain-containing protein [Clostridia bacterium]|nr:SH3 domain-containing protein [Clostridia bacterium]